MLGNIYAWQTHKWLYTAAGHFPLPCDFLHRGLNNRSADSPDSGAVLHLDATGSVISRISGQNNILLLPAAG